MRSVVVVLPASMCAMMPILRIRSRGMVRFTDCYPRLLNPMQLQFREKGQTGMGFIPFHNFYAASRVRCWSNDPANDDLGDEVASDALGGRAAMLLPAIVGE